MIRPKQRVCDVCGEVIPKYAKTYKIAFKDVEFDPIFMQTTYRGYEDMCHLCMSKFKVWINKERKKHDED